MITYWRNWKKVKLVDPGFHLNHDIIIVIFAHQGQTRRFPEVHHPLLLLWCIHQAERYVQTYKLVRVMGHLSGKFDGLTGHADRALVLWCETQKYIHSRKPNTKVDFAFWFVFICSSHIIITPMLNVKIPLSPIFIQKSHGLRSIIIIGKTFLK